MAARHYVGTSGFSYPHWREVFYPQGLPQRLWLEHYAQHFATVELNSPFYRLPTEKAFVGWRERTPEGFRFAVKASRFITHVRRLQEVQEPLWTLLHRAGCLREKLGPILYQLPPDMPREEGLLEAFLSALPWGFLHAVEFQHRSWYEAWVFDLLRRYAVALCIHDMRDLESPVLATAPFAYIRLHGPTGHYAGSYADEALEQWADRIRGLGDDLSEAYIYFNNDMGGHAVHNAGR